MISVVGQPVTVIQKPSSRPGILRFELNRSLTGMGHETYSEPPDLPRLRPPDELARSLFEAFHIDRLHIHSNIVTVELSKGAFADGMKELMEGMFIHYRGGVEAVLPAGAAS